MQRVFPSGEQLQRFGDLERGNQIHDRPENADGVAGFLQAVGLSVAIGSEQACETGGNAGADSHREAVARHGGRVDPGLADLDGEIVDKVARLEIIRAVEYQIETREQLRGVSRVYICDDSFDGDAVVDGMQLTFGGDGFWKRIARVGLVEKCLALQVRRLHEIAVDHAHAPNAGANEQTCGGRANRAATCNDHARRQEPLLSLDADAVEQDLAGIFLPQRIVHGRALPVAHNASS
jgi:hypothetical protein